jgi:hypothetical protein
MCLVTETIDPSTKKKAHAVATHLSDLDNPFVILQIITAEVDAANAASICHTNNARRGGRKKANQA